ncbi:MAG: Asp-tRNA(Asn)/Glu-tRNA(Gln) amidotransferase subunit GatC [bacterium]|nr:Asp-tRNA(Asn)/Glu-tRNA(Gln) amidotransferase subunit GatC [bacterium]
MHTPEIEALAELARIYLSEEEKATLAKEVEAILAYVEQIQKVKEVSRGESDFSPLRNVMREDGKPHESGAYTETLLEASPKRHGNYVKVKKIL